MKEIYIVRKQAEITGVYTNSLEFFKVSVCSEDSLEDLEKAGLFNREKFRNIMNAELPRLSPEERKLLESLQLEGFSADFIESNLMPSDYLEFAGFNEFVSRILAGTMMLVIRNVAKPEVLKKLL